MTRESYPQKLKRLSAELASLGYRLQPIEPKHSLYGPQCQKCLAHVVYGTGDLILGKWCGRCSAIEQESHEQEAAA